MKYFIGLDPGSREGGIVILDESGGVFERARISKTTLSERMSMLEQVPGDCRAILEKVGVMPGQGVSSSFKFGVGYGEMRASLVGADISFEEKVPRVWQKHYNVPTVKSVGKTKHKQALKARAQEIFPKENIGNEVADAYLIADYCRKYYLGIL